MVVVDTRLTPGTGGEKPPMLATLIFGGCFPRKKNGKLWNTVTWWLMLVVFSYFWGKIWLGSSNLLLIMKGF